LILIDKLMPELWTLFIDYNDCAENDIYIFSTKRKTLNFVRHQIEESFNDHDLKKKPEYFKEGRLRSPKNDDEYEELLINVMKYLGSCPFNELYSFTIIRKSSFDDEDSSDDDR